MIGYTTLPIVAILSFFIGSVLALQAGYSMQNFGAKQFIGSLVGLSMARELGPVMVAILLAGRVGSAITAELAARSPGGKALKGIVVPSGKSISQPIPWMRRKIMRSSSPQLPEAISGERLQRRLPTVQRASQKMKTRFTP